MPFLRSLNRFTGLFQFALRHVFSIGVWWPLLIFSGMTAVVLLGLSYYTEPALYAILNPYLQAMGKFTAQLGISPDFSSQFSHYPAHFRLLAGQFEWTKLPVALLLEGVAIALTARAFANRLLNSGPLSDRHVVLPQFGFGAWMKIVLIWFLIYLLISAAAYSVTSMLGPWLNGSPRRAQAMDLALFTLTNIIITPFVYVFPLFGIGTDAERRLPSLIEALSRSWGLFKRYPITALSLVLLPSFIFVYPLTWAVSPSSGFASKLQPEFTIFLLLGLVAGNFIVNFLYAGATAKLILEESS